LNGQRGSFPRVCVCLTLALSRGGAAKSTHPMIDHRTSPHKAGLPPSDPTRSWEAGGTRLRSARLRGKPLQFAWFARHGAADSKAARHEARVNSGDVSGHHGQAGHNALEGKAHRTSTSRNNLPAEPMVSAQAIRRQDRANDIRQPWHDLPAEARPVSNSAATTTPNGRTTNALTSLVTTWRQVSDRDHLPALARSRRSK
jgi:hypothetical protein